MYNKGTRRGDEGKEVLGRSRDAAEPDRRRDCEGAQGPEERSRWPRGGHCWSTASGSSPSASPCAGASAARLGCPRSQSRSCLDHQLPRPLPLATKCCKNGSASSAAPQNPPVPPAASASGPRGGAFSHWPEMRNSAALSRSGPRGRWQVPRLSPMVCEKKKETIENQILAGLCFQLKGPLRYGPPLQCRGVGGSFHTCGGFSGGSGIPVAAARGRPPAGAAHQDHPGLVGAGIPQLCDGPRPATGRPCV